MNEKLQGYRWLKVIPSDTINIPFPGNKVFAGTASATNSGKLEMATATFYNDKVKPGDIIYNTTDLTIATVSSLYTVSGTVTSSAAGELNASASTFSTSKVRAGDIVHNKTTKKDAVVLTVESETKLTVSGATFSTGDAFVVYSQTILNVSSNIFASGETFVIYADRKVEAAGANRASVFFVGVGGNISFVSVNGDVEIFKNVSSGTYHPVNASRINSTGTTATDIVALW